MNVRYNFKVTFDCGVKYKEERISINGDFNTQIAWFDAVKQSVIIATENNMRLIKISLFNIEEE